MFATKTFFHFKGKSKMAFTVKKSRKATAVQPHMLIDAGPGSAKTTTLIAGLNMMTGNKPEWYDLATDDQKAIWKAMQGNYSSIGFCAFNRSIADELKELCPSNVKTSTFHSLGLKLLKENGYKVQANADNVQFVIKDQLGYDKKDRMSRSDFLMSLKVAKIIGLIKNNLLDPTYDNVLQVCGDNNVEINGDGNQIVDLVAKCIEKSLSITPGKFTWIDFDDMIWLPVALNLTDESSKFSLLICDETQDLNPTQHELVVRSGRRIIAVGDPNQSIYAFRGADAQSMETMKAKLSNTKNGCEVFPLNTTFRLPLSGVENVKSMAPNLKARLDAPEGEIINTDVNKIEYQAGDLILSRVNGNIVGLAYRLLQDGVAVRIQGKDFAKELTRIAETHLGDARTNDQLIAAIDEYADKEKERLSKKTFPGKLLDALTDKINCLKNLATNCKDAKCIVKIITNLFDNDLPREKVVLLSTVHKAKGLEAERVGILDPSLIPHPMAKTPDEKQQEMNLKFVAETRHKQTLMYIHTAREDDMRDEAEARCIEGGGLEDYAPEPETIATMNHAGE